jgi:hypothetical protein
MTCRAIALGGLVALMLVAFGAASAWAEASTYCVKATKVGKKHTGGWTNSTCTAVSATHEGKYEKITPSSLSESEQQELKALLKYVKVQASGVAGKPTVQVSGANVQIVSGAGKTEAAVNGEGNLVIGYDEGVREQTGSHNLILGTEQSFTSFGGILGGYKNAVTAPYASVSGGYGSTASAELSSVSGGQENKATQREASVSGGFNNTASALFASVSGGGFNTAGALSASVSGGVSNTASAQYASVSGGHANEATAEQASVSGGYKNTASGNWASVSGGLANKASGQIASVSGGDQNTASGEDASVSGGFKNTASGLFSSIFGGKELLAKNEFEACGGNPTVYC